jgi:hypothetical protein
MSLMTILEKLKSYDVFRGTIKQHFKIVAVWGYTRPKHVQMDVFEK